MSITERENEEILGRADLNDVEAILAIPTGDPNEIEHIVKDNADAIFTWDYSLARPGLRRLYEKAKTGQWNATTDLPWDTDVDLEASVSADLAAMASGLTASHYDGTPVEKWGDKEWTDFAMEQRKWSLSQFIMVNRARFSAPQRSPRPSRGTTPSCTPAPRWSTRLVTSRCSPAISTRSWVAATRSTRTCGCCSTTSSTTAAGT